MTVIQRRQRRILRIRKHIMGTSQRPRLAITISLRHIYAQLIDDIAGHTLVSISTRSPKLATALPHRRNKEAASLIGETIGQKAKEKGIVQVVLDRRSRLYHGRVQALAQGARKAGLKF